MSARGSSNTLWLGGDAEGWSATRLCGAIDWSYQLCSDAERPLLARLSVFADGCSGEAAESICHTYPLSPDGVFELLAGLVTKSLVVAQREDSTTRYRLLETIREYGEDRLAEFGETDQLRRAHGDLYLPIPAIVGAKPERHPSYNRHEPDGVYRCRG
jgi:non-specific serine/threonine protein kinase